MNLSIVIPCYNEAANVPGLKNDLWPVVEHLKKTAQWPEVEVIFVDDGSKDNTVDLLNREFEGISGVKVVRHSINQGLGAALRTGFAACTGDIVLTTDSDATYSFSEIEPLLNRLTKNIDIVTASPYHPGGGVDNVPGYRIFLSKGASSVYRVLVNPKLHTYTSMFRAYRRTVLLNARHEHNGFLGVTEILVRAMLDGAKVAEHPCRLRVRKYGQSKAKVASITRSHIKFQRQVLFYRVANLFGRKRFSFTERHP